MDNIKKGYNWKARRKMKTTFVPDTDSQKVTIDLEVDEYKYDEANPFMLPGKKRKTKVRPEGDGVAVKKKLSKKQRKHLEHIIDVKEKKLKHAELLESLSKVQVSDKELALFTSTTDLHRGRQRSLQEKEKRTPVENVTANAIAGSNRKRKQTEDSFDDVSSSTDTSSDENDSEIEDQKVDNILDKMQVEEMIANVASASSQQQEATGPVKPSVVTASSTAVVNVAVNRTTEIQEQRLKLPILAEEQVVMETINENEVVILCGETGSGKTTQVPQFLYEAGYAHGRGVIAVTEPRRVAAVSMSKRVAHEMNLSHRDVSYQIRYEGNVTDDTRIKFMTDGVLLKEVQNDFLLSKYSVVIIDEAHERSVYTDILIGLLSRIVPVRKKRGNLLKLIIMSATLRVEDFTENPRLFKVTPPVVKVESRQFPVTVHFNKTTPVSDYLGEAYKKVCKIHRKLPEGGILVFVTGQQEVHTLCSKLKRAFPFKEGNHNKAKDLPKKSKHKSKQNESHEKSLPRINLEDYSVVPADEEAELNDPVLDQSDGEMSDGAGLEDSDCDMDFGNDDSNTCSEPIYPLPLYSLLSTEKQSRVFEAPPVGCRLCVVATNVAETSITIPNIKYVVDTGRTKTKFYDKVTGVSTFKVTWTSKASANQRAGRAGRTSAGHSYRLYSSAVFNDEFEEFSPPEIVRRPVDDLLLQMKSMCIDKVINFPFPTPPSEEAIKAAENLLISLGAVEKPGIPTRFKDMKKVEGTGKITPLGQIMAKFPVAPRYGKMLSLANQHDLLAYVVAMVSALSVQEVFIEHAYSETETDERQQKTMQTRIVQKTWAGAGHSLLLGDLSVLLKAVGACEYTGCTPQFCEQQGIRYKAMLEIRKLRAQLTNAVNSVLAEAQLVVDPQLAPPSDLQCKLLRQIVLAGLGDHVARKMAPPPAGTEDAKKLKFAYQCTTTDDPVFIHPGSVLYKCDNEYLLYQNIQETSKLYMKGISVIEPDWLPVFVSNHCGFSKPLEEPEPRYDVTTGSVVCQRTATFGPHSWLLAATELPYPAGLDCYKWFARYLLDGSVCERLQKYTTAMLSLPVTMIRSWAKLQPRTESLLKALLTEKVSSKERLENVWKKNPNYLLKQYCEWLPEVLHADVATIWPPLSVTNDDQMK